MTNNPERKARKKLREKRAKYEKDPSPSLLEEIQQWEERLETLLKCKVDGKKKMAKVENVEKTDELVGNKNRNYFLPEADNILHR